MKFPSGDDAKITTPDKSFERGDGDDCESAADDKQPVKASCNN